MLLHYYPHFRLMTQHLLPQDLIPISIPNQARIFRNQNLLSFGCCGADVARDEYNEETALADISGVKDTDDVVVGCAEFEESCAVAFKRRKFSNKLRRRKVRILN
jgi:hypothetical protein